MVAVEGALEPPPASGSGSGSMLTSMVSGEKWWKVLPSFVRDLQMFCTNENENEIRDR